MSKRNFNRAFRRYSNQQPQLNAFSYNGPYPQREIYNARQSFTFQFYSKKGQIVRSLQSKVSNTENFHHQQQMESLVGTSFSVIQEDETNETAGDELCKKDSTTNHSGLKNIDIFSVDNDDAPKNGSTIEVSDAAKLVSINCTGPSQSVSTETNDNQKLKSAHPNTEFESLSVTIENKNVANNSDNHDDVLIVDNHDKDVLIVDNHDNDVLMIDSASYIVLSSDDEELEDGELEEEVEVTELCLMCDLCLHIVKGCTQDSKNKMNSHFKMAKHNAASLIEAIVQGDKLIPKRVEEKHCMGSNLSECSIIPVCPECDLIHGSVWTCAMHYQKSHNVNEDNVYGLGKVVAKGFCNVSSTHVCTKCSCVFPTASKLHKHWKSSKHFPFKQPPKNQIMQFECQDCGRKEQAFLDCRGHILSAHSIRRNNEPAKIKYIYLEKTKKLFLLPWKPIIMEEQVEKNAQFVKKAGNRKSLGLSKKQWRRMRTSLHSNLLGEMSTKYEKDKKRYNKFLNNVRLQNNSQMY